MRTTRRALLSVSDRSSLVALASGLVRHGYELLSTGGTADFLTEGGFRVTPVRDLTGFPEVFGGRVKTLHPAIFGGLLFDRSVDLHRHQAEEVGIEPIDVAVVNFYPFEEVSGKPGVSYRELVEKIDVGGPAMLRAAAKNHAHVAALCDPADYAGFVDELDANDGVPSPETRRRLAAKAFRRSAAFDAAIAAWLTTEDSPDGFPERLTVSFTLSAPLRYGENPHQRAAFYREPSAAAASLGRFSQLQGKELSYTNLLDADAALFASRSVGPGTLTIVKHRIASGIARSAAGAEAFEAAWASDPVAGFGGVVAYTGTLHRAAAEAMTTRFLEVVVAEDVSDDAREVFTRKQNLRVLTVPALEPRSKRRELRSVSGGLLVQEWDDPEAEDADWKVVSKRPPTADELDALRFLERAMRGVMSNAVVVGDANATYGIGGGRTSRVDAARDAVLKAGERARGAAASSDAFFPFPDGLLVLADAGVSAVVQPGGSVKDADVIAAADERGVALVFSGRRHFRH